MDFHDLGLGRGGEAVGKKKFSARPKQMRVDFHDLGLGLN